MPNGQDSLSPMTVFSELCKIVCGSQCKATVSLCLGLCFPIQAINLQTEKIYVPNHREAVGTEFVI